MSTHQGLSLPGVHHHLLEVDAGVLHHVSAGEAGPPIVLVHGFPESWWVFHKVIPLLAAGHRVFAVDLRGFGDSSPAGTDHDSSVAADDLHRLIRHLAVGPVHLVAQDFAGGAAFRLATDHPVDVASVTGIEMGLAGFGLEGLADVTRGGSWHIGALTAPGIPELLFAGREHDFLRQWFPAMTAVDGAVTDRDLREFVRGLARPGGWRGATGIYRSVLTEGDEFRSRAAEHPITVPVLAMGGFGGTFAADALRQVTTGEITSDVLPGVGHHVALEAPHQAADSILNFLAGVDD